MEKRRIIELTFFEGGDEDNDGYTYYFDNKDAFGYIQNIAGLGFALEDEFSKYGNRFYTGETKLSQVPITFTLYLKSYADYNDMMQKITNAKYKCQVNYRIDLNGTQTTFNKDVIVVNFTKGEKNIFGLIPVEVEMMPLSFWYRYVQPTNLNLSSTMTYYTMTNDSQLPAEIKLKVAGAFTNMTLQMTGTDIDTQKMELINTSISSTEALEYSSEDGDSYIRKVDQFGNKTDLMTDGHVSVNNSNIFKVPAYNTVNLGFKAGTITGTKIITLKIKKFYVSV